MKVRWAGPFVLALLLAAAAVTRAPAAPRTAATPVVTAVTTVDEKPDCFKWAVAYVAAVDEYIGALAEWYGYISDPFFTGGDAAERAAERLDTATTTVVAASVALGLCLWLLT